MNSLRHFSADDPKAVTNLGQAAIHLKMNSWPMAVSKEAHTPGRGKVLRESSMGRSWSSRRGRLQTPINTNPRLKFRPDCQALQASIGMVPAMCEPDTSSASPPEEDSGSSHVACSASGSQRSQGWLFRGVELWLARVQALH